ncbi:MAG: phage tail sheath C-terminal domain-containing protein, partial [Sporomusa sp.]
GFTAFDEDAKLLSLMLSNCYKALVYRLDSGGAKATGTEGNLTAQAKYPGTKGNAITIVVVETSTTGVFTVTTYVDGASKDAQQVSDVTELINNDFVVFSGSGTLTITAGLKLTGGANGTVNTATAYPAYLALARKSRWQTMALTQNNDEFAAQFATFADQMRDDEGKYVQVVVANYDAADSISVINSDCGAVVDGVTITAEEATAWVAGITAGASIVQSNVGKVFSSATQILNERTRSEMEEDLAKGMFILSTKQNGDIAVVNDINSLHTFTSELSEDMRLNQVIRVMDEIGTTVTDTWETSFKGKVQNNADGRAIFKSTLTTYFNELQRLGAIEDFDSDALTVEAGTAKDAVVAEVEVDPVAAMSTLYMTIRVS